MVYAHWWVLEHEKKRLEIEKSGRQAQRKGIRALFFSLHAAKAK
jgi:hypothetical protein